MDSIVEILEIESDKENLIETSMIITSTNNEIQTYDSSQLTPNQRHALLFNIGQSFEITTFTCRFTKYNPSSTRKEEVPKQKVLIERFQNSSDHSHTIKGSEMLKRSEHVRMLVEKAAIKNYPPPVIVSAIKEYATIELGLSDSVKELR
ncbi:8529_t:CDS:2 [Cetraspora pellucida]|uniref:8529_t:CDS:1 n=1 Tax=Cetraspora pellucida TaxID=1433469 RepID=A0A9N9DZ10_9GLOM|nr:8529_t:CDS:2 [Cetraspora pellucida]